MKISYVLITYTIKVEKNKNFYLKFKDDREIKRKLGIKKNMEWRRWCKNKPDGFINITSAPDYIYEEWISWFDWSGNDQGLILLNTSS